MSDMADVLNAHEMDYTYDGKQTGCSCGHWQARGPVSAHADLAAHQAAALSAAGFGPVQEAQEVAWAAGYDKGTDLAAWAISNRTDMDRPDTTNPYRTEASS